ncbi:MAG: DUF4037 domain-containing protein [Lachnospiraceae bacterium]|nr:DUF4037 domain-containing protein [Lachnospiraceae bacterium]
MERAIDSSRRFYENQVAPMIKREFSQYEDRIAVGIVGEGSDCFGYDDFVSRDHDFGTGVVLWLTDEDMALFGDELSKAYNEIIENHPGNNLTERLKERRGVMSISIFYNNILDTDCYNEECEMSEETWLSLDHTCLATAVNGEVFRDDLGYFTAFREMLLKYYPERVWKIRIVNELHRFAQSLQVNYARCMSRRDVVAARLCHMQGLDAAMQLFFLMKRIYPPYYKWTYRRLCELDEDGKMSEWIKELASTLGEDSMWELSYDAHFLNVSDPVVRLSERIAGLIVSMLNENGLTDSRDSYLERYVDEIMKSME